MLLPSTRRLMNGFAAVNSRRMKAATPTAATIDNRLIELEPFLPLGSARVTRGNVGDSPQRGNKIPETGLPGCPERIRTLEIQRRAAGPWRAALPSEPQRNLAHKAQLRPIQAQMEATGVNTIRIGHEQRGK